jgi:hypothetical protein
VSKPRRVGTGRFKAGRSLGPLDVHWTFGGRHDSAVAELDCGFNGVEECGMIECLPVRRRGQDYRFTDGGRYATSRYLSARS